MIRTLVQVHSVMMYDGCTNVWFNPVDENAPPAPIPSGVATEKNTSARLGGTHMMNFQDQDLYDQFPIGKRFVLDLTPLDS